MPVHCSERFIKEVERCREGTDVRAEFTTVRTTVSTQAQRWRISGLPRVLHGLKMPGYWRERLLLDITRSMASALMSSTGLLLPEGELFTQPI